MLPELQPHPHAAAVLGSALTATGRPAHAYLFSGPRGVGKRTAAVAFAAELLAWEVADPQSARLRARAEVHPDLSCIAPSGAHGMLRRDIDDAVVAAATRTPFEARYRVFVLDHVDTLNDEAANSLLKTLEEPASYVVLILITNRYNDVLPTIRSRCQLVRFDPLSTDLLTKRLIAGGVEAEKAAAAARLSLGDSTYAHELTQADGDRMRQYAHEFVTATLNNESSIDRCWLGLIASAREIGDRLAAELDVALEEQLQALPKKEHRKRKTECADQKKRVARRAQTAIIDRALQLIGLYYRDLACIALGSDRFVHNRDLISELKLATDGRSGARLLDAVEQVDDVRSRLQLNVSFDLAFEVLAYRVQEGLSCRVGGRTVP